MPNIDSPISITPKETIAALQRYILARWPELQHKTYVAEYTDMGIVILVANATEGDRNERRR